MATTTTRKNVIWAPKEFQAALAEYADVMEVSRPDILRQLTPFIKVAARRAKQKAAEPAPPPPAIGIPPMLTEEEAAAAALAVG